MKAVVVSKPKTTTGKAADQTVKKMVKDSKAGKGTLSYEPNDPPLPPRKKIRG